MVFKNPCALDESSLSIGGLNALEYRVGLFHHFVLAKLATSSIRVNHISVCHVGAWISLPLILLLKSQQHCSLVGS